MNLLDYCTMLVVEGNHNREIIADILMASIDSVHEGEQAMAWQLLRNAGMPFYAKESFLKAADLAIEIVNGDEPPRAA